MFFRRASCGSKVKRENQGWFSARYRSTASNESGDSRHGGQRYEKIIGACGQLQGTIHIQDQAFFFLKTRVVGRLDVSEWISSANGGSD